ncbi:MAG: c-type cytochrome [Pseudomonadota bacterium]
MASQAHVEGLIKLLLVTVGVCGFGSSAWAVDAEAAKTFARQHNCFTCHAIDKKKIGPSYQAVATKYRNNANAESLLITHVTMGAKMKFPDGHEEDHMAIKSPDKDQIKNLVAWILTL